MTTHSSLDDGRRHSPANTSFAFQPLYGDSSRRSASCCSCLSVQQGQIQASKSNEEEGAQHSSDRSKIQTHRAQFGWEIMYASRPDRSFPSRLLAGVHCDCYYLSLMYDVQMFPSFLADAHGSYALSFRIMKAPDSHKTCERDLST